MNLLTTKLYESVVAVPQQIAVQSKDGASCKTYTYAEFYANVEQVAWLLLEFGIEVGDRVALIMENRPEWGMIYFGILLSGAVAVPLDAQASADDCRYFLEDSASKIIITSAKIADALDFALLDTPAVQRVLVLGQTMKSHAKLIRVAALSEINSNSKISFPTIAADATASILYTSGTTGKPKGVMLTQQNFYANYASISELKFFHQQKHNVLAILPLHHAFPFMATLLIPLFSQCVITYVADMHSEAILNCMRETQVTTIVGVPSLFYIFYKRILERLQSEPLLLRLLLTLSRQLAWLLRRYIGINLGKFIFAQTHHVFGNGLRFFVSGGAKLDTAVAKLLLQLGFDVIEGYGLTETAPIIALNLNKARKIGSVGKPMPQVQVRIYKPDVAGNGEIVICGPNVMRGYFNMDAATNAVLRDGWFYSGDLGYIDRDGYLYVTGRQNELIVLSSGKNIAPEELELVYSRSKYIKELCILAVQQNMEEKLVAVIVPNLEYAHKIGEVDIYGAIKWDLENISKQLSSYKRVMGFVLTHENLSRTNLGKLKRFVVQRDYTRAFSQPDAVVRSSKQLSSADEKILNTDVAHKVMLALHKEIGVDKCISLDDHLELDLGLVSLKRIELMALLEQSLCIKIASDVVAKIANVRELVAVVDCLVQTQQGKLAKEVVSTQQASLWSEILGGEIPQEVRQKIVLMPSRSEKIADYLLDKFLSGICKLLWRVKTSGLENLPQDEAYILCPNHSSFLDGFVVAATLPEKIRQQTFFLGITTYFNVPIVKKLLRFIRVIPIDPGAQLITAMQAAAYVVTRGKILCLFPEGARSIDGTIKEFKNGVGILARELNVRLLPVYLAGAFEAWPRLRLLPKLRRITVKFGKPCDVAELRAIGMTQMCDTQDEYAVIAAGIRAKVQELQ